MHWSWYWREGHGSSQINLEYSEEFLELSPCRVLRTDSLQLYSPQMVLLPRHCLKTYKSSVTARAVVQQLRVCTEKDMSLIPSTHGRQLITVYNSNSRRSNMGNPQLLKIKQIPLLLLLFLLHLFLLRVIGDFQEMAGPLGLCLKGRRKGGWCRAVE